MSWFTRIWSSSIGKKILVAATGLALLGFLFGHLFGNVQLFWGADKLNAYAAGLHEYWFLPLAEIGIATAFIVHIGLVIKLTLENRSARGTRYAVSSSKNPGFKYTTSISMLVSGLVVLTFLVIHILDYRLARGAHDAALVECLSLGTACGDTVGAHVVESLMKPWRAVLYAVGSLFIGWHLFHGIQSAARSFGISSQKWTPVIDKASAIIGIGLGVLFASIPIAIILTGGSFAKVDQLGAHAPVVVVADEDTVQIEALGEQVELIEEAPAAEIVEAEVADAEVVEEVALDADVDADVVADADTVVDADEQL